MDIIALLRRALLSSCLLTFAPALLLAYEPEAGGIDISTPPIINGEPAESAPPWMTAILWKAGNTPVSARVRQVCGGSLIAPSWVLTAAHCVQNARADRLEVLVGSGDLEAADGERREVAEIVVHPFFAEYDSPGSDLALLRLASPSTMSPILLAGAGFQYSDGEIATVYGWGRTLAETPGCELVSEDAGIDTEDYGCRVHDIEFNDRPGPLMKTEQYLLSDQQCVERMEDFRSAQGGTTDWNPGESALQSVICGWNPDVSISVCYGDSGGPLVLRRNGEALQIGIIVAYQSAGVCKGEGATSFSFELGANAPMIDSMMGRNARLSFERFCPRTPRPDFSAGGDLDGKVRVRIAWEPMDDIVGYRLRYTRAPGQGFIGSVDLDGGSDGIDVGLSSGDLFYITLQAYNDRCNGPMSKLLRVEVP